MHARLRHALALVPLLLLAAVVITGCGDGSDSGSTDDPAATAPAEPSVVDGADPAADDADAPDEDAAPSAAAVAAGRGLDRLAAAYAPVSDRINFLVAAETLRADAVDSDAGDAIERERAGVVRIEIRRMQGVLAAARPRVAAVPVRTAAQQQVQQLLLEAIDVRRRAMTELVAALEADGLGLGDTIVEERFDTWRASWGASLRATREATTTTQDARAALGLEPAPEEALR